MKKEDIPVKLEELQAQLLRERKAHEKEIKRLEKELAVEKLYGLVNKTMIDLAEKKYNMRPLKNGADNNSHPFQDHFCLKKGNYRG